MLPSDVKVTRSSTHVTNPDPSFGVVGQNLWDFEYRSMSGLVEYGVGLANPSYPFGPVAVLQVARMILIGSKFGVG